VNRRPNQANGSRFWQKVIGQLRNWVIKGLTTITKLLNYILNCLAPGQKGENSANKKGNGAGNGHFVHGCFHATTRTKAAIATAAATQKTAQIGAFGLQQNKHGKGNGQNNFSNPKVGSQWLQIHLFLPLCIIFRQLQPPVFILQKTKQELYQPEGGASN